MLAGRALRALGRVISNFCCTLTLRPSALELLTRRLTLRLLAVSPTLERSLARLSLLTLELLPLSKPLLSGILATLSAASAKALLGYALALHALPSKICLQWIPALGGTLSGSLGLLLPGARLPPASLLRRGEAPIHKLFFDD